MNKGESDKTRCTRRKGKERNKAVRVAGGRREERDGLEILVLVWEHAQKEREKEEGCCLFAHEQRKGEKGRLWFDRFYCHHTFSCTQINIYKCTRLVGADGRGRESEI